MRTWTGSRVWWMGRSLEQAVGSGLNERAAVYLKQKWHNEDQLGLLIHLRSSGWGHGRLHGAMAVRKNVKCFIRCTQRNVMRKWSSQTHTYGLLCTRNTMLFTLHLQSALIICVYKAPFNSLSWQDKRGPQEWQKINGGMFQNKTPGPDVMYKYG